YPQVRTLSKISTSKPTISPVSGGHAYPRSANVLAMERPTQQGHGRTLDDDLRDVELESVCECGHRNPEHSLSGQCHGCHDCDVDADHADAHHYTLCRSN